MMRDDLQPQQRALEIHKLVHEYQRTYLPTMNGGFAYSNLVEGPQHLLTCLPYRMWEYSSLFLVLRDTSPGRRFLDVGGAASPLVYFLAENEFDGVTIDLQPLLVDLTNYVASVRRIPLKGIQGDITHDFPDWGEEFDFATFISVLEHIPRESRHLAIQGIHRMLKPGGLLYMTFDYGQNATQHTSYRRHEGQEGMLTESISDLDELATQLLACGFDWVGNDIRELPSELRQQTQAPDGLRIRRQLALNIGPVDGGTPWSKLFKYALQRTFGFSRASAGRYGRHNFFRLFLRKK